MTSSRRTRAGSADVPYAAKRGTNSVQLTFSVGNTPPGSVFQVYGIVSYRGTIYTTTTPIAITVQ